jgi:hypothetical protein
MRSSAAIARTTDMTAAKTESPAVACGESHTTAIAVAVVTTAAPIVAASTPYCGSGDTSWGGGEGGGLCIFSLHIYNI